MLLSRAARYVSDEAALHLLPRALPAARDPGHPAEAGIDHFALNADDRPAVAQRLRAAGQAFDSGPLADSGIWEIFLRPRWRACRAVLQAGRRCRSEGAGSPHQRRT